MSDPNSTVFVVDDDCSVRESLVNLLSSIGLKVEPFATAREFLSYQRPQVPSCLVLDVRMPGLSGLELQRELVDTGEQIPIIFVTGHGDIPMSVRAMKAGAVEFLPKPFREQELLDAIGQALERDELARSKRAELAAIRSRCNTLTAREREVMNYVVKGLLNKQVAANLGVTEITVKIHRRHLMQKMGAASLAELVRMVERLS